MRLLALRCEGMLFWVLMLLVALAPLPFGSDRSWAAAPLALVTGALLVGWSLASALRPARPSLGPARIWPIIALFAVAPAWALVQLSPWTPADWHHPMWYRAAEALGPAVAGRITLHPFLTEAAIMRLLTYGGVFWLAFQFGQSGARARQVLKAITLAGLCYAFYGLAVYFLGVEKVLWYDKGGSLGALTSTFFVRNTYATYAGLGLLCAMGLALTTIYPDWRPQPDADVDEPSPPPAPPLAAVLRYSWWRIAAALCLATALALTHSRAGIASSVLGLVVLLAALGATGVLRPPEFKRAVLVVGVVGVVIAALAGSGTVQRFAKMSFQSPETVLGTRYDYYGRSLDAVSLAPVLGIGYGNFFDAHRMHQGNAVDGYVVQAHGTYVENLMELGVPAAASLFAAVAGTALVCFRGLRYRRRDRVYPAVGLAATALVGAHALVDFSLEVPAVAVTYAAIMGVACAQSFDSFERGEVDEFGWIR